MFFIIKKIIKYISSLNFISNENIDFNDFFIYIIYTINEMKFWILFSIILMKFANSILSKILSLSLLAPNDQLLRA